MLRLAWLVTYVELKLPPCTAYSIRSIIGKADGTGSPLIKLVMPPALILDITCRYKHGSGHTRNPGDEVIICRTQ